MARHTMSGVMRYRQETPLETRQEGHDVQQNDLPRMQPGDLRQITSGAWKIDLIYRTDGRHYIACQRDTPTRRLFDVIGDDCDETTKAAVDHMIELDAADGLV